MRETDFNTLRDLQQEESTFPRSPETVSYCLYDHEMYEILENVDSLLRQRGLELECAYPPDSIEMILFRIVDSGETK